MTVPLRTARRYPAQPPVRDCKGHAPQNQSALAQRMIETLKAYLSHSRQLSLF